MRIAKGSNARLFCPVPILLMQSHSEKGLSYLRRLMRFKLSL